MSTLPPYLTDEEVFEICRPRTQGAAQCRYLRRIGVPFTPRGDGTPLVWRRDLEGPAQTPTGLGTFAAPTRPNWTTPA